LLADSGREKSPVHRTDKRGGREKLPDVKFSGELEYEEDRAMR